MRHHIAALALFGLLAVGLTWPLLLHVGTHLPGEAAGDNVTFAWNVWWMREALAGPETFFRTDRLMAPFGADLTLHTHTALPAFVGATVLGGVSIITAQNLLVLGALTLNGFAAYLLGWRLTRHRAAAVMAGLAFAAAPYFAARLHGHFNLVHAWGIPLYLLALGEALDRRQRGLGLLAGAVAAATLYTDYYYVVFLGVLTLCVVLYRWFDLSATRSGRAGQARVVDRVLIALALLFVAASVVIGLTGGTVIELGSLDVSLRSGRNLRTAAWMAFALWLWRRWRPSFRMRFAGRQLAREESRVVAAAGLALITGASPLLWHALRLWLTGGYVSVTPAWRSSPPGVDLAALVAGSPFHPLWGTWVARFYAAIDTSTIEGVAWLGLAPVVVLLAAGRWLWAREDARLWIAVGVVFLVWALGPYLLVLGVDAGLPLPAGLLRYVPVISNARVPSRAIVVVHLAVAMLLAVRVAGLPSARSTRWAWLLGCAILADFIAIPVPLHELLRPVIYAELAALPPGAVLELPFGVRDGYGEDGRLDHDVLYFQTLHGQPLVGGFVARLPESTKNAYRRSPVFGPLLRLSTGEPTPGSQALPVLSAASLRQAGVRYVVLNVQMASPALRVYVEAARGLRLLEEHGGRRLYAIE